MEKVRQFCLICFKHSYANNCVNIIVKFRVLKTSYLLFCLSSSLDTVDWTLTHMHQTKNQFTVSFTYILFRLYFLMRVQSKSRKRLNKYV